jgi:hypothetical protein
LSIFGSLDFDENELGADKRPLIGAPLEAYQFDWSQEILVIVGATTKAKVAQVRLCHSPMPYARLVGAPTPASRRRWCSTPTRGRSSFSGGAAGYDNMRTAVEAVFVGKERQFNRRLRTADDASHRADTDVPRRVGIC